MCFVTAQANAVCFHTYSTTGVRKSPPKKQKYLVYENRSTEIYKYKWIFTSKYTAARQIPVLSNRFSETDRSGCGRYANAL
jgi:hypothetical protein